MIEGVPHQPGSKFLMKFETEGQKFEFVETLTTSFLMKSSPSLWSQIILMVK